MKRLLDTLHQKPIKKIILISILIFAVLSCLGCFELISTSMVSHDLYKAGDVISTEAKANLLLITLPLCILQCIFIFSDKKGLLVSGFLLSIVALFVTVFLSPLIVGFPDTILMGGLAGTKVATTWIGYLAMGAAACNAILQAFYLLKKQHQKFLLRFLIVFCILFILVTIFRDQIAAW